MPASTSQLDPLFGFLRVADLGGGSFIGGYLVVNALGRPIEFHCTEPVVPNRAQRILYGATLDPYLYGEQIGRTLVDHSPSTPGLLVTDQPAILALRSFTSVPIVWRSVESDIPDGYLPIELGPNRVLIDAAHESDVPRIQVAYQHALPDWRLDEPLERIDVAISELRKAA